MKRNGVGGSGGAPGARCIESSMSVHSLTSRAAPGSRAAAQGLREASLHLLRRHLFDRCRDEPLMPERIGQHATALPMELVLGGSQLGCPRGDGAAHE